MSVAVVGYGVTLRLRAPFQTARIEGHPVADTLVLARVGDVLKSHRDGSSSSICAMVPHGDSDTRTATSGTTAS